MNKKTILAALMLAYGTTKYFQFNQIASSVEVVVTEHIKDLYENTDTISTRNAAQKLVAVYREMGIKYPRVVLAQNLEETGYFGSRVAKENNNVVGMKRSKRTYALNPIGAKKPRDCPCYDWELHACYKNIEDGLQDYADWQKLILQGYEEKFGRLPNGDEEYIAMLDHLWFPGAKSSKRYAKNPAYRQNVTWFWKNKVLKYVPQE